MLNGKCLSEQIFAASFANQLDVGKSTERSEVKRLTLRKKYAKSAAGRVPHHSYNGLTNILGASRFGGQRPSVKVRLDARLPGAERAFLLRLGQAHGAAHSQYLFRR